MSEEKSEKEEQIDFGLKEVDLDTAIALLTKYREMLGGDGSGVKLRIINRHGEKSCVGKMICVNGNGEKMVAMLPCPEGIDRLMSTMKLMAMMCCDKAMNGQNCDTCKDIASCEHMKRFDDNFKYLFENEIPSHKE